MSSPKIIPIVQHRYLWLLVQILAGKLHPQAWKHLCWTQHPDFMAINWPDARELLDGFFTDGWTIHGGKDRMLTLETPTVGVCATGMYQLLCTGVLAHHGIPYAFVGEDAEGQGPYQLIHAPQLSEDVFQIPKVRQILAELDRACKEPATGDRTILYPRKAWATYQAQLHQRREED
jgi:hypothetical protein